MVDIRWIGYILSRNQEFELHVTPIGPKFSACITTDEDREKIWLARGESMDGAYVIADSIGAALAKLEVYCRANATLA